MIFGKIDYINLLPFHVFLKKSSLPYAFKGACEYKKAVPSIINNKFRTRRLDAAVISSIESARKNISTLNLGIVAKKNVKSVIVKVGLHQDDPASATSNMLAKVMCYKGEVIIGDRALKLYLDSPDSYVDLAYEWSIKYQFPFVFGRLCVNKYKTFYKNLAKQFIKCPVKIPHYILKNYAIERGIDSKEILNYLKLLSYNIGKKEEKALLIFLKKAKRIQKMPC